MLGPSATPTGKSTPMSQVELEARALARAKERHIHVMSVPGRPGVYQTSSKSEPGTKHIVVSRDGIDGCDCKGFQYRKSCCHVEALRSRIAREQVQAERRPRATAADLF